MSSHEFDKHSAMEILFQDVLESKQELEKRDTQGNRRNYVRNVYAGIEAFTNWLKQLALYTHAQAPVAEWSASDLAMLREETYHLDENGVPKSKPKFLPTDTNLRFVIQLLQKFPRPTYSIDWKSDEWKDLRLGLKVRHRITHPKDLETILVSDSELVSVKNAHKLVVDLFFQPVYEHIKERDAKLHVSA